MKLSSPTLSLALLQLLLLPSLSNAFSPTQINHRCGRRPYYSPQTTTKTTTTNDRLNRLQKAQVTMLLLASKVGIFFGTSTGNTENVADLIAAEFGDDAEGPFEIDDAQGSIAAKFAEYDALVVGTPTWNTGADSERSGTGWDEVYYGEMQDLKLEGKNVAVFGLGDQISYAENYADASGELHDVFQNLGCNLMGYTSQDGYEHEASKAIRGDKFCGLLCDEINQDDLSEERVQNWIAQLKEEGFMDGINGSSSGSLSSDTVSSTPTQVVEITDENTSVSELQKENAELRMMLEENSKLFDEIMQSQENNVGYTPHYNPKTQVTMWTSADGRSCYYTTDQPKSP